MANVCTELVSQEHGAKFNIVSHLRRKFSWWKSLNACSCVCVCISGNTFNRNAHAPNGCVQAQTTSMTEVPEIYALRRNHDDIVGAMSHDLDYFKRMFVQAGFIRSPNASDIMGLLGVYTRLREGGAAPRVTPDPNLRVYASGNAAAEVSQVCSNANERGVYGRSRQQNSAQLWYVGGAG